MKSQAVGTHQKILSTKPKKWLTLSTPWLQPWGLWMENVKGVCGATASVQVCVCVYACMSCQRHPKPSKHVAMEDNRQEISLFNCPFL